MTEKWLVLPAVLLICGNPERKDRQVVQEHMRVGSTELRFCGSRECYFSGDEKREEETDRLCRIKRYAFMQRQCAPSRKTRWRNCAVGDTLQSYVQQGRLPMLICVEAPDSGVDSHTDGHVSRLCVLGMASPSSPARVESHMFIA